MSVQPLVLTPDVLTKILQDWRMRFQDPTIQQTKGRKPKFYIRPVVPILKNGTVIKRQKRIVLGRVGEMTVKEAAREKQRVMAEINGGDALITAQIKMSDLIAQFTDARLPFLASTTRAKYAQHLKNHVATLAEMRLFEVTPLFVQSWILQRDLGSWARADLKNLLSAMFKQAKKWKMWEGENPIREVELPRMVPKRKKRIPNEEQIRKLREGLDCCGAIAGGLNGSDVRMIIDVLISTGWRISEVLGLQRDAIEGEVLEVKRRWCRGDLSDVPKTEAGKRKNYVGPLAKDLLARIKFDFVFCGDNERPPDDRDLHQHILRPVAEAVGCYWEGFGFHSFRRLNNTWRQEAGATPAEVMRALGHTKPSMMLHYTVVDVEREKQVVEQLRKRVQ